MDSFLSTLYSDSPPPAQTLSSANTVKATCRKCRRELIIDAILRLIQYDISRFRQQEQQYTFQECRNPRSTPSSVAVTTAARRFPFRSSGEGSVIRSTPDDVRLTAAWLLSLDREAVAQYVSVWHTWAGEVQNPHMTPSPVPSARSDAGVALPCANVPSGVPPDSQSTCVAGHHSVSLLASQGNTLSARYRHNNSRERKKVFQIDPSSAPVFGDIGTRNAATAGTSTKGLWRSLRSVFMNRDVNGANSSSNNNPGSSGLPLAAVAKRLLGSRYYWTPSTNAVTCSRCKVWLSYEAVCCCSMDRECFPCSSSRLKAENSTSRNDVWDTATNIVSSTRRNYRPSSKASRRSHSCPILPLQRATKFTSTLLAAANSALPPEEQPSSSQKVERPLLSNTKRLARVTDLLMTAAWASQEPATSSGSCPYISHEALLLATPIVPFFIRLLPPTHYVTLFHGLNGMAKDYRKFVDLLLRNHPSLHCFVPDCYSNRAIMGVVSLTEILRDYLFVESPQPLGAPRIPRSPDLLSHLVDTIPDAQNIYGNVNEDVVQGLYLSFHSEQQHSGQHHRTVEDAGRLLALPNCRYAMGDPPFDVVRSRIFLSFIGHSLGGIIARSVAALNELRFPLAVPPRSRRPYVPSAILERNAATGSQLPPPTRLDAQLEFAELPGSHTVPRHQPSGSSVRQPTYFHEPVALLNFVTFASPHNGTFEDFLGVQAVSYLVPTGRDLITASPELLRLASPEALLPLSRFRVLALYGNVCNDFLVGPLTSLLIDPVCTSKKHRDASRSAFLRDGEAASFSEFPLCAREACANSDRYPVELDAHGFVVAPMATTTTYSDVTARRRRSPKCDTKHCIHRTGRWQKRRSARKLPAISVRNARRSLSQDRGLGGHSKDGLPSGSTALDFVGRLGRDSRKLQTVIKAGLPPMGWSTDSSFSSSQSDSATQSSAKQQREPKLREDDAREENHHNLNVTVHAVSSDSLFTKDTTAPLSPVASTSLPPDYKDSMKAPSSFHPVNKLPPVHHVRHLSRLPWRRFGVLVRSTFRAHNCIIWHGRLDPGNLGKRIVQHFIDNVFVHAP